ncbi:uncharacterized protein LOC110688550 [Chenopodium quinoa]|uniref:uncharacterized protein LOC110688550 n=1 Tax=Chenopodium quinoa TaxID=63459 RepID=UPI000B7758E9|nr:uncharacterized protein LOC110688550 [Chenopodium quinoa]
MASTEIAGDVEFVDVKVRLGGVFVNKQIKGKTLCGYEGGWDYWRYKCKVSEISVNLLRETCIWGFVKFDLHVPSMWSIWYKRKGKTWSNGKKEILSDDDGEFTSDSEELDSPRDDEQDNCPWFHASVDFKKPIQLLKGQKFLNNKLLRKALKLLAIENRVRSNLNLTAEFLAEKYIEDRRSEPGWKIKSFRRRVLGDFGIEITYSKAWKARARAKLKIYGSAAEQYARVWDYGKALMQYSPGSECNVVVDGLEQIEPPLFLRMFICLALVRKGFLSGCRPLIGVDGCHLKGPYPGQILVAVGKDGNNQIYPIAWATTEIENTETWVWFPESLMKALKDENRGLGYTFISDRKKGLVEALQQVVPYADTRYCVRHIWANFKLQFSGSTFKELFWLAARATTLFDFEVAMESIRFLSEEAYEYLANIPAKHWSRHTFSTFPKSNMLLNNICETFNVVIKEARDKLILTRMEWLRRYMMKRNNEKWESFLKMEGKVVPYVKKTFQRIEPAARHCIVQVSRGDSYEVELNSDLVTVDLSKATCTCFHWDLTGIPCVHAYACIMDKRADPEDYVDSAYLVSTYMLAYRLEIAPMPGPKHWEKVKLRQPLPPAIKVQPGRPKSKKRKLEQ